MNDSLDTLVSSVTRCQEDAIREILNVFLKEMNDSFGVQFSEFGKTLSQLKEAQADNVNYTTNLYQAMSRQLSDSYAQHEQIMKRSWRMQALLRKNILRQRTVLFRITS